MTREEIRELAMKHLAAGDATGWFDVLYSKANGDAGTIPWADLAPNPNLLAWLDRNPIPATGRALVVGCGLGDDAEEIVRRSRGLKVTAFDIAPNAIAWCRKRFPDSRVDYQVADLLNPPASFHQAFDFVFESYTLQALPTNLRKQAIAGVAGFVAPGGRVLIICRGREATDPDAGPPWPLTREDLSAFTREQGLIEESFEDFLDPDEDPPARRFRCVYRRQS
jgi:SAM-dependent methyltransferase